MKRMMELNGVANISLLMQCEIDKVADETGNIYYMNEDTYNTINKQLKLLEKYMKAYNEAVNNNVQTPFWHDIRDKT